jgi:hypothetical protein
VEDALGVLLFVNLVVPDAQPSILLSHLAQDPPEVHEDHGQAFLDQFNDAAKRTAKNRRPRTDLMLGSRINDRSGVVPEALGEFLGKVQPSYERYLDWM